MSAVWMWVRTEWRQRWGSLLALALVVAIGGGATLALAAGARRADTAFDRFSARTGAANIVMSEFDGSAPPAGNAEANRHLEILDQARAIDGVEATQVRLFMGASPDVGQDTKGSAKGRPGVEAFIQGYAFIDPIHPPFLVVAGTLPGPDDAQGVVINEAHARQMGLTIGSGVDFNSAAESQFVEWAQNDGVVSKYEGPRFHAVVRAITRDVYDVLTGNTNPNLAMMPGISQAVGDQVVQCKCFVAFRVRPDRLEAVRAQLTQLYAPYGLVARPPDDASGVTDAIRVEVITLSIAALVAAIATLLVAAQFAARTATAIATRRDALRGLGMVSNQRFVGVLLILAPAVLVGSSVAAIAAYAGSGLFPRGLARSAEPEPGLRFDAQILIGGGVAILVAVAVIALAVSRHSNRIHRPRVQHRASGFVRLFGSHPTSVFGARFASDPVGGQRSRGVAIAAISGIALAAGGVVAVATIQSSRNEARANPSIYGAPGGYYFNDNGSQGAPLVIKAALAEPQVTAVSRTVAMDDKTTAAIGPRGAQTQVQPLAFEPLRGGALPRVVAGSMPRGNDELALGIATARELGASIGDLVSIDTIAGQTRQLRVVGTVISWSDFDAGHAFIVSKNAVLDLACENGVEAGCNLMVSAWASTTDAAARQALLTAGFIAVIPPTNLDRLQQVGNIPWYLAGLLVVLGLAGIGHALATALRRRRSDLAIGRALGWRRGQAGSVLIWQAALTGLVGAVVGVALGLVLGRVLWRVIANSLDIVIRPSVPIAAATLAVAGLVAASLLLALPASARARRLRTAEALHSE